MYEKQFHADELAWQATGIDGVEFKVLDGDPGTGPSFVMYRFAPGSVVPEHFHSKAAEVAYVLEGELIEAGKPCKAGTVFTASAGVSHGPHETRTGCTVVFALSEQLDFVPVG